ncbi:Nif3-like dinuclear metal center hexameric protein [Micromonospora sp. NPDC049559]|uniref:Nif3-like dinuclear metal center hexameric protein n=1 Tax=Micromonospora sp. NPDC049559 TaxID=3155923 RepID=UPI003424268B
MSTTGSPTVSVGDVVAALERRYPPAWAEQWDRVGLVVGDPAAPVRRVACAVDCVPETVAEALAGGADMIVAHHPLLLRGVHSVAATTYKGRIVHQLIKNDVALYVAHTNADVANPGVSDALAARLGLVDLRPLHEPAPGSPAAGEGRGIGRVGRLPRPMTLAELTGYAAAALPATAWGVRAAGEPDRLVRTVAVSGGAGDGFLADAAAAGADAFLTADLRHHPASEHVAGGGPALLDAAHWATERPWLDQLAAHLRESLAVSTLVSDLDTDPWTVHAPSPAPFVEKEPRP